MALTPSTMLELGTRVPHFALPDCHDEIVSLSDFDDLQALVILFICNHCPYVKLLKAHLAEFARQWQPRGVAFIAINSNDTVQYPDDAPARMREDVATFHYPFPYLVDASQEIAKAFRAACTPDIFVFDGERNLAYRGQYDSARPGNGIEPTGADLAAALEAVLAGQPPLAEQKPATGCNIKWKPGNAPEYYH
jgi:thiol-disulfide isomerase/thioredoxin